MDGLTVPWPTTVTRPAIQVNFFQNHLFLHQLTHNMTKDCSLNYKFSHGLQSMVQYMKTPSSEHVKNMLCTYMKLFWMSKQTQKTICVQNMFLTCSELGIFIYWTRNSMNNLASYCGLVEAKMRASDKYLPVPSSRWMMRPDSKLTLN